MARSIENLRNIERWLQKQPDEVRVCSLTEDRVPWTTTRKVHHVTVAGGRQIAIPVGVARKADALAEVRAQIAELGGGDAQE